jgi:phosphatidylcholine synthase
MEDLSAQSKPSRKSRLGAYAVHLYTASGAVITMLILLAAFDGNVTLALWLLLVALLIDSTDGTLARRFRVSEILPGFDGARLDDIVDYMTYALAPVMLLWMSGYLPPGSLGLMLASLPLLASSYQFCQTDAKTEDHFFRGFPSYWNVVAFYAIIFDLTPGTVGMILLVCSLLVFVPLRYVYPSRTKAFRPLTLGMTALWVACYAIILLQMPEPSLLLAAASLIYIVYYLALSIYLMVRSPDSEPATASD